jgi:hypothetical protein
MFEQKAPLVKLGGATLKQKAASLVFRGENSRQKS